MIDVKGNKDVIHNVAVKFSRAFLPEAKKLYYLRTAHQKELDISAIASMANVYNMGISPKVIEEGMNAGMELVIRSVSDGFKVRTPFFTVKLSVPGEYDGTETHLPEGVHPVVSIQASALFRNYIKSMVKVDFDGKLETEGFIACAFDEASGLEDDTATRGDFLTVRGIGLKIISDADKKDLAGLFFVPETGVPVKADKIAVNQPRTLKVLVPTELVPGMSYKLAVETQCSAKTSGHLLKEMRDMRSDFTLTAE